MTGPSLDSIAVTPLQGRSVPPGEHGEQVGGLAAGHQAGVTHEHLQRPCVHSYPALLLYRGGGDGAGPHSPVLL